MAGRLNKKDIRLLCLIAEGKTSREIAELDGVTKRAIDGRRQRLQRKLEVDSIAGMIRFAVEAGLLHEEEPDPDIVEILRSIAHYRSPAFVEMAEHLPGAVYEMDLTGRFTFVTSVGLEMFGYSRREFVMGSARAVDLVVEADRPRAMMNMLRIVKTGELGVTEYTGQRKDGTTFPITIHSIALFRDGEPVGVRGVVSRKRRKGSDTGT